MRILAADNHICTAESGQDFSLEVSSMSCLYCLPSARGPVDVELIGSFLECHEVNLGGASDKVADCHGSARCCASAPTPEWGRTRASAPILGPRGDQIVDDLSLA